MSLQPPPQSFGSMLLAAANRAYSLPKVYPFYLLSRAKRGLLAAKDADPERIIESVDEIETIGDCRHAMTVKDTEGNTYRITVEVDHKRAPTPESKPPHYEFEPG